MDNKRLVNLDFLRALASISVLYYHFSEYFYKYGDLKYKFEGIIFYFTSDVIDLGKLAVGIFFAISGFVVPYSLLKPRPHPIVRFGVSRLFRLYPAYWVSVIVSTLVLWMFSKSPSLTQVAFNFTMVQQFLGYDNINGVYWTLHIELVFYAVLILMLLAGWIRASISVLWCALLFVIIAVSMSFLRFYIEKDVPVAIPLCLSLMFWGLLNRSDVYEKEGRRNFYILTVVLLVCIPIISLLAYNKDYGFRETWHRYTITYYLAMLIFWSSFKVRIPLFSVVKFYSNISYSFYLFGLMAQITIIEFFGKDYIEKYPIHLFLMVTFLLNTLVSWVVYKFVERPAVALGVRISSHLRSE